MANKSGYQRFRGNPENKLFYLIDNFIGGINTEFTDDSSSVADFEKIVNFDMDKLGALHKRQGFGELKALSEIFNKLSPSDLPVVKNRTETNPNPEYDNDNIVYVGLLKNDNNCFRNLAGFSGKNGYREYQKMYGFQNNTFILLIITTNFTYGVPSGSRAWYYHCTLPSFYDDLCLAWSETYLQDVDYYKIFETSDEYFLADKEYYVKDTQVNYVYKKLVEGYDYTVGSAVGEGVYEHSLMLEGIDYEVGDPIEASDVVEVYDTLYIQAYSTDLAVTFNWDRNLMNMENIEYYNKIYFTNNDMGLVCFDREAEIYSDETLASAFTYSGFAIDDYVSNSAYKPTAFEVTNYGYNLLGGDSPITYIADSTISSDSIQGCAIFTKDFKPTYDTIPAAQQFMVGIYYTGTHTDFTLTFKDVDSDTTYSGSQVSITENSTYTSSGLKVYNVDFLTNPNGNIELKVEMQNSSISPYYDYFKVGAIDSELLSASSGINIGSAGLIFVNDRAVYYQKDTIFFSQINDFTYIPSRNYITLPLSSTDEITKICYFKKSYIIFTKYQIHKMTGNFSTTSTDFKRELVNESLGCHAGNTVVPIDNTLYFASPRGLYALKSNQFVEGYENVVELDTKVKTLTSDYTLYAEDREKPAIRYNGINEHAYAFRYKDKYVLFYNNYGDKGDYAAENGLDALVYSFEIGSYTTYRFKEKPTFLFMIDNAVETFATVKENDVYSEESVLFNYNFTTLPLGDKVTDLSGNGNDATLVGNAKINESVGIELNGTNAYGSFSNFDGDITNGFNIQIDTKCNELNGAYLIDIQQENAQSLPTSGNFTTNVSNNIYAKLEYTITPNSATKKDSVAYRLYLIKNANLPTNTGNLQYSIKGSKSGESFVSNVSKAYNLSNTQQLVDSGTFIINRNNDGSYTSNWTLNIVASYVTTSTGVTKGPDVNKDGSYYATSQSWIDVGFANFLARATDTGCSITYTPAIRTRGALQIGSREVDVTIDGQTNTHTVTISNSSSSQKVFKADQKTINLTYTGTKNVSINIVFHANFKRVSTNTWINDLKNKSAISYDMPSVTPYTNTVTTNYSLVGSKQISFAGYGGNSYRQIAVKSTDLDQLQFIITSEQGNKTITTDANIGLLSRHTWNIDVSSSGTCNIYKDGIIIKTDTINPAYIITANRTINNVGKDRASTTYYKGEIYNIRIGNPLEILLEYDFKEGTGTIANDSSAYNRGLTLVNTSWVIKDGLVLNDNMSYLSIPKLDDEIKFSNGFKIEFEGTISSGNNLVTIIDLAKYYGSESSSLNFNSINVTFKGSTMAFNSTGLSGRAYKVEADNINTNINHTYKVECINSNDELYDISMYVDGDIVASTMFAIGGIADTKRSSNLVGKSNDNTQQNIFNGNIKNLKLTIFSAQGGIPVYRSAIYEFDTTPTDFSRPIYIDVMSKGVNLDYPQHMKKLKNTFIKLIGGDEFSQLYFELYADGHLVNDPTQYICTLDDNGTIVLDYATEENLDVLERLSLLGGTTVDRTRLDKSTYQTIKMVVPKKAKNFALHIYGDSKEFLTIDSFGMVCKLGKVKQG